MSAKLFGNNPDGANFQAQAVLAMVRYQMGDGIESSWNPEWKRHTAEVEVSRFDNCREQGYILYLRNSDYSKQINLAFYEHRNSDSIYAQVSYEKTFNAPRLENITSVMPDKFASAFNVRVGEVYEMAKWIADTLTTFWDENLVKPEAKAA